MASFHPLGDAKIRGPLPNQVAPRLGLEALQGVLDKATKARTRSIQLQGMDFADELSKQLLTHAGEMETIYAKLKSAVSKDAPDEAAIQTILSEIESKNKWYDKAEAGLPKHV